MGSHLVEPGAVLADRYVVEDLLAEEGESNSWRAHDNILARSVVLQILPTSSSLAADLVNAAKQASRVADPRLLQVLDAVDDGELTYVVREWATGQSLDVVLAEGPLPARRAAWLVREVAAAMANAHAMGLAHRRLAPDTVVVTKSSGVKVVGLGTFAVLQDEANGDGMQQDTQDLGRLLYACLTARWPGNAFGGLPAAPTEHGRLLRPRQVRAGVPRPLDAICDRVLSDSSRYGAQLTTVTEVEEVLSEALAHERVGTASTPTDMGSSTAQAARTSFDPPPALLPREDGPPTGELPRSAPVGTKRRSGPLRRTLTVGVAVALVAGVLLLAYLVGQQATDKTSASETTPTPSASQSPPQRLQIESAVSFDPPPGTGDENPDEVPLATDGDPSTAWETLSYESNPELGGLKPGVGLLFDLGRVQSVRRVDLGLPTAGTDLEIRIAPADTTEAPAPTAGGYDVQKALTDANGRTSVSLRQPVQTRFVLVWLTKLPPEPGGLTYRGSLSEVRILG